MQLSLATNVSSESVMPGGPANGPLTSQPAAGSTGTAGASFEELLPEGKTAEKTATDEKAPDAEKASSILACSVWIPGMLPPPAPADPGVQNSSGGGAPAIGGDAAVRTAVPNTFNPPVQAGVPGLRAGLSSRPLASPAPAMDKELTPKSAIISEPRAPTPAKPGGVVTANVSGVGRTGTKDLVATAELASAEIALPGEKPTASVVQAANANTMPIAGVEAIAAVLPPPPGAVLPPGNRHATNVVTGSNTLEGEEETDTTGATGLANITAFPTSSLPGAPRPVIDASQRTPASGRAEKIAAAANPPAAAQGQANPDAKKDFLTTGQVTVNMGTRSVGIGVAQGRDDMPAAPSNRPKSAPTVASVLHVAGPSVSISPTSSAEAPVQVAALRETMAAVVNAVEALEHRAETAQKSVDLQLHVGTERLALHVELRDGTVHTTFRTESPELRAALSHEWRSVVQTVGNSELRIADPVFVATPTGAGQSASGSPGQGTPNQRGQDNPESGVLPVLPETSGSEETESAPLAPAAVPSTSLFNAFA